MDTYITSTCPIDTIEYGRSFLPQKMGPIWDGGTTHVCGLWGHCSVFAAVHVKLSFSDLVVCNSHFYHQTFLLSLSLSLSPVSHLHFWRITRTDIGSARHTERTRLLSTGFGNIDEQTAWPPVICFVVGKCLGYCEDFYSYQIRLRACLVGNKRANNFFPHIIFFIRRLDDKNLPG